MITLFAVCLFIMALTGDEPIKSAILFIGGCILLALSQIRDAILEDRS